MSAPRGSTFYLDGAGKPAASPLADDGGLVGRFLQWQREVGIYRAVPAGFSGAGRWSGSFTPSEWIQVRLWLKSNGVHLTEGGSR